MASSLRGAFIVFVSPLRVSIIIIDPFRKIDPSTRHGGPHVRRRRRTISKTLVLVGTLCFRSEFCLSLVAAVCIFAFVDLDPISSEFQCFWDFSNRARFKYDLVSQGQQKLGECYLSISHLVVKAKLRPTGERK